MTEHQQAQPDEEISLKELIAKFSELYHYVLSQWKTIALAGTIGALLGLGYSFIKKPVYKAEFSFVLEDEKSGGLGGALSLASQFGIDIGGAGGGGAFAGDNLIELMKSRTMVQQALLSPVIINGKKESLLNYFINFNHLRDDWANKPQLSRITYPIHANPAKFNRQQDSIVTDLHKDLIEDFLSVAKFDKKLSVINVEVKATNELFAKAFAEALVAQVSRFYVDTKTQKSAKNVAILQHQADSVRQRLNAAIGGVALANDANPNLNPTMQVLRVPSQQRQVDVQANTAILTELVKNLELAKLALRRETPLIQVLDKPVLPLEVDKVGKLKGLVLGGFLAGILMVVGLILKRIIKSIIS
jgi:uncharacterized protein involved in exopolysaccharide biosynthesis